MNKSRWDRFEWDDENKKNGNVQHLRDHGIEPGEAENVSCTTTSLQAMSGDLTMFMF